MNKILSENDHISNDKGPGSVFNKKGKKVIVPPNTMHLRNFFSDMHYHLYVKYGLAKAVRENKDIDTWKKIYEKMQEQRVGDSDFRKFDLLLDSIYGEGYNTEQEAIPVDNAFNILDGSHRLAGLAVTGEHPIIEVLNYPSHSYDRKWFANNGFSQEEMEIIQKAKKEFFQRYNGHLNHKQLGFIWGSTIQDLGGSWDSIINFIGTEKISDFYVRNFGSQLKYVIDLAYLGDGIDTRTLREKNEWITERSKGLLGVFTYDNIGESAVREVKDSVRINVIPELSEYNFDSIIHSVDEAHPRSNKIRLEIQRIIEQMNALLYI